MENYIGHDKIKANLKELINEQESLLITGTVGTGKTHLAVACLKEFLISRNNRNDRFVMTSLSAVLADVYSNATAIKPVQKCDLLLIDDLGFESVKEWCMEKIYDIINYRYKAMLPMIITTNLSSKELEAKIGQRSFSRIMSMCKPFVVNGEDYRIRHLKK